jgi:hypothetical protein
MYEKKLCVKLVIYKKQNNKLEKMDLNQNALLPYFENFRIKNVISTWLNRIYWEITSAHFHCFARLRINGLLTAFSLYTFILRHQIALEKFTVLFKSKDDPVLTEVSICENKKKRIIHLGTRGIFVVSFKTWPFYLQGERAPLIIG